jgi:hypothetical protein
MRLGDDEGAYYRGEFMAQNSDQAPEEVQS